MTAQSIVDRVRNLAPPPAASCRLLQMLENPDADPDKIVDLIMGDAGLTAKLLAYCNSGAKGAAEPIESVEHAVFYLGQARVFQLAVSLPMGAQFSAPLERYGIGGKHLWSHSILTAVLTQSVLKLLPPVDLSPTVAYTAALLHDIGKVALNGVLDSAVQSAIYEKAAAGTHSLSEAELEVLGVDHAAVGACLVQKWGLSDVIVEAVANHHASPETPRSTLANAVYLANLIANQTGPATGWGGFKCRADEQALEALGICEADIDGLFVAAVQGMENAAKMEVTA